MNSSSERCVKEFCHTFFIPKTEKWTRGLVKKIGIKKNASYTKKQKKDLEKTCKLHYCNPDCKGTVFQKGKEMPILEETKKFKGKNKKFLDTFSKNLRARIFKGKTNVLQNSFYEKLPAKTRKLIKKKGALSGCTSIVLGV